MQDDDFSLFKNELRGVKPIKHDRADTGKPKSDRAQIAKLRQAATVRTDATTVDGLSDQFVIDVGPEDELMWARDGVQESQIRKLKTGQIPFEGSLDLHGMSVEKPGKPSGPSSPKPPGSKSAACASPTARPCAWMASGR